MNRRDTIVALWLVLSLTTTIVSASDYVWWEAESPKNHNFEKKSGFGPKTLEHPELLSGNNWLHTGKVRGHWAEYDITTPAIATYELWVRKFWQYGLIRWRFDQSEWTALENQQLKDGVTLRRLVSAHWVSLGKVKLTKGEHTFHFETTDANAAGKPAAFDCFVLTAKPFEPRGKLKPDEKKSLKLPPDWFAFDPEVDALNDSALLDLRSFNHKICGEKGYLRTRGGDLVWEKEPDKPVRFWGCHGEIRNKKDGEIDYDVRRMAKVGCNITRYHGQFWSKDLWAPKTLEIPDDFLDRFNYYIFTLKKNGVYLMLNTYYSHFFNAALLGLPGYTDKEKHRLSPHFLFIHPEGQKIWKTWVRRLLDTKNPYTGMRNADDPTIAMVQLVNEGNYFFWTFDPGKVPEPVMQVLEKRFGVWLKNKYGSLDKARTQWGDYVKLKTDDWNSERPGLFSVWFLTDDAKRKGKRTAPQRFNDQAQFLTEDLRNVLGEMQTFIKKEIGFKGLVNGANWITADPRVLEPLDKYSAMACDVMDRHGVGWYPPSKMVGYGLNTGDTYQDISTLHHPEKMPVTDIQYNNKPHIISEPKCTMPNRYRAEWFPFMAIYGVLQGTDAITQFTGSANWASQLGQFTLGNPVHMGQTPAAGLIFRKGYVKAGPVVVRESLALADLYQLKGAGTNVGIGMDGMTKADIPDGGTIDVPALSKIDPLAIFTGKVVRSIAEKPGPSMVRDMKNLIDRDKKIIRSATGELLWDFGIGYFTVNAPKAQGAVGFLKNAGVQNLSDVQIDCGNEYASILIIPLDDQPLSISQKILVQVVTEDTNYGWKTETVKTKLKKSGPVVEARKTLNPGESPVISRKIQGKVTLKRTDAAKLGVTALDFNGYKKKDLPRGEGNAVSISLLPDVLYYIVEMK